MLRLGKRRTDMCDDNIDESLCIVNTSFLLKVCASCLCLSRPAFEVFGNGRTADARYEACVTSYTLC